MANCSGLSQRVSDGHCLHRFRAVLHYVIEVLSCLGLSQRESVQYWAMEVLSCLGTCQRGSEPKRTRAVLGCAIEVPSCSGLCHRGSEPFCNSESCFSVRPVRFSQSESNPLLPFVNGSVSYGLDCRLSCA